VTATLRCSWAHGSSIHRACRANGGLQPVPYRPLIRPRHSSSRTPHARTRRPADDPSNPLGRSSGPSGIGARGAAPGQGGMAPSAVTAVNSRCDRRPRGHLEQLSAVGRSGGINRRLGQPSRGSVLRPGTVITAIAPICAASSGHRAPERSFGAGQLGRRGGDRRAVRCAVATTRTTPFCRSVSVWIVVARIEASLCQEACRGASKRRRGARA
jgi:hypothetical protein